MTFATFPESGYRSQPGGSAEIPGFDPNYETMPVHIDQSEDGNVPELKAPLNKGETVSFEALLFVSGGSTDGLKVIVPTGSSGGFHVQGNDNSGSFLAESFGSSDFNTFVGDFNSGAYIVTGVVGAATAGTLQFAFSNDGMVKAGSQLRIYRLLDSKVYA